MASPPSEGTLSFEPVSHIYSFDGRVIPSVSQILQAVGIIDTQWYDDHSRLRGQYVAEATAMSDEGVLDYDSLDDNIIGYIEQWNLFLEQMEVEIHAVEQLIFDPFRWYAGRLDRVATIGNSPVQTLIDIKTGSPAKWHGLQTAGYQAALDKHMNRGCLYLGLDSYTWHAHEDRGDRDVFYGASAVWNWRLNNK